MKKSRSRLFSDAVAEYLARHAAEDVTDAGDPFVLAAARRVLARSEGDLSGLEAGPGGPAGTRGSAPLCPTGFNGFWAQRGDPAYVPKVSGWGCR